MFFVFILTDSSGHRRHFKPIEREIERTATNSNDGVWILVHIHWVNALTAPEQNDKEEEEEETL